MFNNIKIGDRIEISLNKIRYANLVSQVEEVLEEDKLLLHIPILYGNLIKLPLNVKYDLVIFSDRGKISFEAEITSYKREGSLNFMEVRMLDKGKRVQMRKFYRCSCLLSLKFSIVNPDENAENLDDEVLYDGIIKDISGGGIRYVTNAEIPVNSKIKCIIMLGEEYLIVTGKVLSMQHFPKSNYKYQYRVQFIGILPIDREKIIQYIVVIQRKELNKTRAYS